MYKKKVLYSVSLFLTGILVIIVPLSTYQFLNEDYLFLKHLDTAPQKIIVENHYFYSLDKINDFKENYSCRFLLFPIGRLIPNKSMVSVILNSDEVILPIVNDGVGGSWINASFQLFEGELDLIIKHIHKKSNVRTFKDQYPNETKWIEPSWNIDSDNTTLIEVTQNITEKYQFTIEKAREIFNFVRDRLNYEYPTNVSELASKVYFTKKGSCIQYSNLFVALCRAAQIPARTVSGYWVMEFLKKESYLHIPHQWSEFMDEEGYWHQVDTSSDYKTFFDFSDSRFFDLYYADYQNPFNPSQTYFPSIDYQKGEISIKRVTRNLYGEIELWCIALFDQRSLYGYIIPLIIAGSVIFCRILYQKQMMKNDEVIENDGS